MCVYVNIFYVILFSQSPYLLEILVRISRKFSKNIDVYFFFFFFWSFIDSRERGREAEREGEKHRCERET